MSGAKKVMSSFDDFQTNLEALPNILQKKYTLLGDLDRSLQEIQLQNEQRCEQEIEDIKRDIRSGSIIPHSSHIRFSEDALDEQKHAIRIADEKVALAVQAYDLVDAHVQQLDRYLKKFHEDLRQVPRVAERDNVGGTGSPSLTIDSNFKSGRSTRDSGRGQRNKTRAGAAKAEPVVTATATAAANMTSMDLDLPVDPNEPTYCLCNQVSYGEMVACDNPNCKIEWFHFGCVGLKEHPKGKWYCSDCAGMRRRRKGR